MSTLKVNAIQHSTGTAAINIDSSGRVTRPNNPCVRLNGNNGATIDFGGNAQIWTNTYYQQVYATGCTWDGSTGRITVPIAGKYFVGGGFYQQTAGNANGRMLIRKNGTEYFLVQTGFTLDAQVYWYGIVDMAANDYLDCISASFDTIRGYMGASHTNADVYLIS